MLLYNISDGIVNHLERKGVVEASRVDVIRYGLEVLLASALNGALVLVIAILTHTVPGTALLLCPFVLLRSSAGGYHAGSHAHCIVLFLAVYGGCLLTIGLCPFVSSAWFMIPIQLACCGAAMAMGAVAHANRPVTDAEYLAFRRRARQLTMILTAIGIVGAIVLPALFAFYTMGLTVAAISLFVAWIQHRGKGGRRHVAS